MDTNRMYSLHTAADQNRGVGLLETLIAVTIFSLVLIAIANAFHLYAQTVRENATRVEALVLAEEGIEAARHLRDSGWDTEFDTLAVRTPYYLSYTAGSWSASTTATTTSERFTRVMTIDDVYRDSSSMSITASTTPGATLDPLTKHVSIAVSWGTEITQAHAFEDGTTDADLASFPSNDAGDGNPAQSVTLSEDAEVIGVELLLRRATANPSPIYLEIRSGSAVGSVLATSATVDASAFSDTDLEWIAFTFPDVVSLSGGVEYFLRLRSTPASTVPFSGSAGLIHWGYGQSGSSPYAGGVARRYVGRLDNDTDTGQELTQYDFSFRILAQTEGAAEVVLETYLTDLFDN